MKAWRQLVFDFAKRLGPPRCAVCRRISRDILCRRCEDAELAVLRGLALAALPLAPIPSRRPRRDWDEEFDEDCYE